MSRAIRASANLYELDTVKSLLYDRLAELVSEPKPESFLAAYFVARAYFAMRNLIHKFLNDELDESVELTFDNVFEERNDNGFALRVTREVEDDCIKRIRLYVENGEERYEYEYVPPHFGQ